MAVFESLSVLLELKTLSVKEKKKLKSAVTENGGSISYVVNKQCSLVVTSDVANLSPNRLRSIRRHQTPVVRVEYVFSCVETGALLPVDAYTLDTSASSDPLPLLSPRQEPVTCQVPLSRAGLSLDRAPNLDSGRLTQRGGGLLKEFRTYTEADPDLPSFPDDFQVAKYSIFEKKNDNACCVLELHSSTGEEGRQYRVVSYRKEDKKAAVREKLLFLPTSEDALRVYQDLRDTLEASGLQRRSGVPPQAQDLGSAPLQQLLLEEKLNTGSVSQEVGLFVELLWTEALGSISSILRAPVDMLSLNDVSRAEGLLLQAQRKLKEEAPSEVMSLLEEVYTLLPHREPVLLPTARLISQKLDLCQLIRDVLNVSEVTLRSPVPSSLGKYRALRCSIETVPPSSAEFQAVTSLLQISEVQIQQVVRVSRGVELQTFKSHIGNVQTLLHSSSSSNFVGILSRGLLLPRVGVEDHGIRRTDAGNLGSGIYFSDALSTSLKYSKPSVTDGSRLLLLCDVALGRCKNVHKRDVTLTQAPEGHDSVHGVRRASEPRSEFEDDEYVVYSPDQVRLKYVVQFSLEGDKLKDFRPALNMSAEPGLPSSGQEFSLQDDGTEDIKNPLEDVTAGLLDSSGQQLPLQAVHVKCKLMDLLSQVVIFQKYTNLSSVPIEAKYVFPLDDSAAVCGFEAFINGKHVVGQVKEKEKARREYKQAIERGHGAYLMDQDAPDVFTISVGNLPPGATVLIKVTFVSELIVRDGRILFSLPGSVAPWQEGAALNQTTQVTLEKVCVTDEAASTREFSLDLSVEMPYEISSLECITHKVRMKRTDCKAVVSVLPGELMGADGFQLSVGLSEVHLPRMWVEKHPDKDSQACMLVFYPDFDVGSASAADEVVLLLDTSESMKGESLGSAQRIALQVLRKLDRSLRLNVILFGTDHTEAFLTAKPLADVRQAAESFIKASPAVGGSTELWRPLRALSLLPPSSGVRNLLLLSDGHIQNAELTLQLVRESTPHSRLFTCGLSPTANRHMLRALAQAGGGAYEFFDTKTKHSWAEKVACQVKRMAAPGCSSVSVKWQQFSPAAPPPVQAPQQLHALFNDCHTLVYGFVPHCTQATLLGNLSGQELNTMVSTSELQKTKGTFLHKLTARALIRDYEDGNLDSSEAEHEGKKAELKKFIIELSKEFSILSQFTSFVAIEERDSDGAEDAFTDVPGLIAEEDVDFLPYVSWEDEEEEKYCGTFDMDLESHAFTATYDLFCEMESPPTVETDDDTLYDDVCMLASMPVRDMPCAATREREAVRIRGPSSSSDDEIGFGFFSDGSCASEDQSPPAAISIAQTRICTTPFSAPLQPLLGFHGPPPPAAFVAPPPPPPAGFAAPPPAAFAAPPPPAAISIGQIRICTTPFSAPLQPLLGFHGPTPPAAFAAAPPPPPAAFAAPPPPPPAAFAAPPPPAAFAAPPPPPPAAFAAPPPPAAMSPAPQILASEVLPPQPLSNRFYTPFSAPLQPLLDFHGPPPLPPPAARRSAPPPCPDLLGHVDLPVAGLTTLLSEEGDSSYDMLRAQSFGLFGSVETGFPAPSGPPQQLQAETSSSLSEASRVQKSQLSLRRRGARRECLDACFMNQRRSKAAEPVLSSSDAPELAVLPQPAASRALDFSFGAAAFAGRPAASQLFGLQSADMMKAASPTAIRFGAGRLPRTQSNASKSLRLVRPQDPRIKWTKIFRMQLPEGYWDFTTELGDCLNVNVELFANVFLKNKGIHSLGVKAHADILRLLATLLVLQLMRVEELDEGKLLRTLFSLEESSERPERWDALKKAVDWVCWADRMYPCIYSRLEFGLSWESSTRQLLGFDSLPPFSALSGLDLRRTAVPLPVH